MLPGVEAPADWGYGQVMAWLVCDGCGVRTGPFGSYEEWSDAASRLRWWVGEEVVLCGLCVGR